MNPNLSYPQRCLELDTTHLSAMKSGWSFLYNPEPGQITFLGINLNKLMVLYWHCNESLQLRFSLSNTMNRSAYLLWFIRHAKEQLSFCKPSFDSALMFEDSQYRSIFKRGKISIEAKYIAYWLSRSDLRDQFDVWSETGLFQYIVWLTHNRLIDVKLFLADLSIEKSITFHMPTLLNRFMQMVWESRIDLQEAFDMNSEEGVASFTLWFLSYGVCEYPFCVDIMPKSWHNYLDEPSPYIREFGLLKISRLMHLVWSSSKSLRSIFKLKSFIGRMCYYIWYYCISRQALKRQINSAFLYAQAPTASAVNTKQNIEVALLLGDISSNNVQRNHNATVWSNRSQNKGINIIGPISGTFGLSQHARYVECCLQSRAINSSSIDFHTMHSSNRNLVSREKNIHTTNAHEYDTSLFCANPDWLFSIIGSEREHLLSDKFNIQYGYWELANYPEPWLKLLQGFDELWAPSKFIYDALKGKHHSVHHMPVAVHVDESLFVLGREQFGLPQDHFLFYFSFDGFSYIARKNPLACIRAFRQGFPLGTEPVGLVVKCRNMISSSSIKVLEDYFLFLEEIKKDKRIYLIEEDFPRSKSDALMNLVDCYVSLHRSEGFGYGMAEAMYLGKAVIVTAYSGNLDFTNADNSCLVNFELIKVLPDQYIFAEGQVWAEADIEHAAWYMKQLYEDNALLRRIKLAGRNYMREYHSVERISSLLCKRLAELGLV